MRVVLNTSPLILLTKIGRVNLLNQLYDEVIIPDAVTKEIKVKSSRETLEVEMLLREGRFRNQRASQSFLQKIPADLGLGEREAIALGLEMAADLLILDDHRGRQVARGWNISTAGTIGVLVEDRDRGLIPSIRNELDHLIEAGMWVGEMFYHRLLREFNE